MPAEAAEVVGSLLFAVGNLVYAAAIIRGKAKPNVVSWAIWSTQGALLGASFIGSGGSPTHTLVLMCDHGGAILVALILIFRAVRLKEYQQVEKLDLFCLAVALAAVGVYAVWREPVCCQGMLAIPDVIAGGLTIKKAWVAPSTEDAGTWVIFSLAGVLNLLLVQTWTLRTAFVPLDEAVENLLTAAPLLARKYRRSE